MTVKPTDDVQWATVPSITPTDPGTSKKQAGFLVNEAPPAHWFDWLFRAYYRWISFFSTVNAEKSAALANIVARSFSMRLGAATRIWSASCWSPELGLFCMVSIDGTTANQIQTSPDGVNWTSQTSPSARQWRSVCWSPALTLFVAVASDGTAAQQVMTSPDGVNWTAHTAPSAQSWYSVCWSPALNLFVATALTGTAAQQVMTSPDGVNWTARTSSSALQWYSVCWSPELALFVAVAQNGTAAQQIMTSTNGTTWIAQAAPSARQWTSVCWAPELGLFCAVSFDGTLAQQVMTSPDGVNWTAHTAPVGASWQSVCWAPEINMFCAVGSFIMTSPDGTNWVSRGPVPAAFWIGVSWSPKLSVLCAGSASGLGAILVSGQPNIGTTTNDNAAAGSVGELVTSTLAFGSGVSLVNGTAKTITSITLTPGDWDISAVGNLQGNLTGTGWDLCINTTTNALSANSTIGDTRLRNPFMSTGGSDLCMTIPPARVSIASNTTYYLVITAAFSAGTATAQGRISARRVR